MDSRRFSRVPAKLYAIALALPLFSLSLPAIGALQSGSWRFVVHSQNYDSGWAIETTTNTKQWLNQSCRRQIETTAGQSFSQVPFVPTISDATVSIEPKSCSELATIAAGGGSTVSGDCIDIYAAGQFRVAQGRIYCPDGSQFVPRGVNTWVGQGDYIKGQEVEGLTDTATVSKLVNDWKINFLRLNVACVNPEARDDVRRGSRGWKYVQKSVTGRPLCAQWTATGFTQVPDTPRNVTALPAAITNWDCPRIAELAYARAWANGGNLVDFNYIKGRNIEFDRVVLPSSPDDVHYYLRIENTRYKLPRPADNPGQCFSALRAIPHPTTASFNNVPDQDAQFGGSNVLDEIETIVEAYRPFGVVVLIDYHAANFPWRPDEAGLQDSERFMVDAANRFANEPFVWLQPWNEPLNECDAVARGGQAKPVNSILFGAGENMSPQYFPKMNGDGGAAEPIWLYMHNRAVVNLADANYQGIIVANSSGFGQDRCTSQGAPSAAESAIRIFGPRLLNLDQAKRRSGGLLFDLHFYSRWAKSTDAEIVAYFEALKAQNIAVLIGEIGGMYESGDAIGEPDLVAAENFYRSWYRAGQNDAIKSVGAVAWSAGMGYTLVNVDDQGEPADRVPENGNNFADPACPNRVKVSKSSLADMQRLSPNRESSANLDRPKNLTPHGRLFWDFTHQYRTSNGSLAPFVALQEKADC